MRSDAYRLPATFESADPAFVRSMLGGHVQVSRLLKEAGTPLAPLPFRGAIYRVGQSGSHSQAPGFMRQYVVNRRMLRKPAQMLSNLARVRVVTPGVRLEFFGA